MTPPEPTARWRLAPWRRSLRARLLALLLGAITLATGLQAAVAYSAALAEADALFDYHMRQMALSLRSGAPLDDRRFGPPLPPGTPDDFEFIVQVWSNEGARLFEFGAPFFRLPDRAVLGYSDIRGQGRTFRVFSVQTRYQVIQVAQDRAVRTRMARSLAWRTVAPVVLAVPLLGLAVWWVVSSSLTPVERVRRQLAARRADDLADVDADGLPDEVQPLVDELNALLARLRRAFDAQQAFVADAAHELRSPLAALRLQAQALARATDEPTRRTASGRLTAGLDRAARLLDQLLVLAREEANPSAPGDSLSQTGRNAGAGSEAPTHHAAHSADAQVRLDQLAQEVLAELAPLAQARQQALALEPAPPIRTRGRADALAIALRNLVDNALKYTPAGGRVQVGLAGEADGSVRLWVDDSGPGIPPELRESALGRFRRLDRPGAGGSDAPAGSGLGLSIVQTIARRHGGSLRLSDGPLGGLRAELHLPGTAPQPQPQRQVGPELPL